MAGSDLYKLTARAAVALLKKGDVTPLELVESYEANRHKYDGNVTLERTGSFGYAVRVVPRNSHLASVAELGLVHLAPG